MDRTRGSTLSTIRLSGEIPPVPAVPLLSLKRPEDRPLYLAGLAGLGLLGFFLAVGGTVSLPVGGAVSLLWPAVALQFVLGLWFGWPGVAVAVLFPIASNLLVADAAAAIAFSPANVLQAALPMLVFRRLGGSPFLARARDLVLLAVTAVVASTLASITGVGLRQLLAPEPNPAELVQTWAATNSLCGFLLSWPLLRWVSPVLWEVSHTQRLGKGLAFGWSLVGSVFTLAGGAVATAVTFFALKHMGLELPERSLPGLLGLFLLPAVALGVRLLWRFLAEPLDRLIADTEVASSGSLPPASRGREPAELAILRQHFAQTVARLTEQQRRFRDLFAAVGEPILLVDPQGRLVDANPAFERVFGVPLARARGRNLLAFNDPAARRQLAALLRNPPREPVRLRARVRLGGKGFRQVSITVAPWQDERGNFAGFCVLTADITREEEAAQRAELAARLASLHHLLAGLAHEVNNLLQAGVSELETLGLEQPALVEKLRPLWHVLERAEALVRRVALLAGEYRRVPVEAFGAGELLAGVTAGAAGREANLRFSPPASYPLVRGERTLLRHAMEALVRNALEASAEDGTVEVRFTRRRLQQGEVASLPAGEYLVVEVADRGHGIAKEHLKHVFDPFYTTRNRATHQGLGLTLARAAAEHAGGALTLESTPGEGTVARLWLPVAEEPSETQAAAGTHARVLVVDDDPQVRQGLAEILRALGAEATPAADGHQALLMLGEKRLFDVVILDLVMPGLSGFEVLEQLRGLSPNLPVVLSSGYAADERVQKALQQPGTWYLQKPYTAAHLEEVLEQALAWRGQRER